MTTNIKRGFFIIASVCLASWPVTSMVSATNPITEYSLPNSGAGPTGIAEGPDGAMWFTETMQNSIGRIDVSGVITEFPLPTPAATPIGIAPGPDGAMWFTEEDANQIGRITMSGVITEYAIPIDNSLPLHITAGPDNAMWFTQHRAYAIGRIAMDGTITEYSSFGQGDGIALGPDGALWATSTSGNRIGRMTTSGGFTSYVIPTVLSVPIQIAAGTDGAMWFTEYGNNAGNQVGRIAMDGTITEIALPETAIGPYAITRATDGNVVWLSAIYSNKLISVAPDWTMTEYTIPTSGSFPTGMSSSIDGNVWFTENSKGKIGVLTTFQPVAPDATSLAIDPASSDNIVSTATVHTLTALRSDDSPATNITVRYSVSGTTTTNGPCVTDANGVCSFSYVGPDLPGADAIVAYADNNENGIQDIDEPSINAAQAWLLPEATTGQVTGGGHIDGTEESNDIAFGFTAKSTTTGVKGHCEIITATADVNIKCTDVTVITANTTSATIFGNATINGVATTYRIDVTDNGEPGIGTDTFSVQTSSGYYASGTLAGGNISMH